MNPQNPTSNNPSRPQKDTERTPLNDAGDLSLSEEPSQPVTVVTGNQPPNSGQTPAQPPQQAWSPAPLPAGNHDIFGTSAPPTMPAQPEPSKKKKFKLLAIIAGVAVILLGASAAAYFQYYLPNQSEQILKTALANSFSDSVSSVHFVGEVEADQGESGPAINFEYEGALSQEGHMKFSMGVDVPSGVATFEALSKDGRTIYLKLEGLQDLGLLMGQNPESPSSAALEQILSTIDGQWYTVNENMLQEFLGGMPGASSLTPTVSKEDAQKLSRAYNDHTFLKVRQTLPDETVGGVASYHYKVAIDSNELKAFIQSGKDAGVSFLKDQETVDGFYQAIDGIDFSNNLLDVWIAKDTKMFTQMAYVIEQEGATYNLRHTITEYNTPVEVEEPEGARPITEAFSAIYQNISDLTGGPIPGGPENLESQETGGGVSL